MAVKATTHAKVATVNIFLFKINPPDLCIPTKKLSHSNQKIEFVIKILDHPDKTGLSDNMKNGRSKKISVLWMKSDSLSLAIPAVST
jgi:hypothetical protein